MGRLLFPVMYKRNNKEIHILEELLAVWCIYLYIYIYRERERERERERDAE